MYLPFHHIILYCVEASFYFIHIQYQSGIEFCFLILISRKGTIQRVRNWDHVSRWLVKFLGLHSSKTCIVHYFPCFSKYRATIRKLDTKGTVNYNTLLWKSYWDKQHYYHKSQKGCGIKYLTGIYFCLLQDSWAKKL